MQREVQDRVADLILAGGARPEQMLELDVEGEGFVVRACPHGEPRQPSHANRPR